MTVSLREARQAAVALEGDYWKSMKTFDHRWIAVPVASTCTGFFWRERGGGGGARRLAGLAAVLAVLWSGAAQGQLTLNTAAGNFDVTKVKGNESDGVIAYNPQNPAQMFIAANTNVEAGLFGALSINGGSNWTAVSLGNLPAGAYPAVAWDGLGNLFLAYVDGAAQGSGIDVAVSTNGGTNFSVLTNYASGLTNLATGDFVLEPGSRPAGRTWAAFGCCTRISAWLSVRWWRKGRR